VNFDRDRAQRDLGITRLSHIVVNVRDLERSAMFYEALGPLRPRERGSLQLDGSAGLGIGGPVHLDWLAMDDGTMGDPVKVILAQWRKPALTAAPYPSVSSVGIVKFAFHNPDPETKLERLRSMGVSPTNSVIVRNYVTVLDPDGTIVSFRHTPGAAVEQLFHVHISTRHLARYLEFCDQVLDLEYWMKSMPNAPQPSSQGPGGDLVQWNSHFMRHPGDHRFTLDIGEYVYPEPQGEPHRYANAVGIAMIGFEVLDIETARNVLATRISARGGGGATLQGGVETWTNADTGAAVGVLHCTDPDGNLLQFAERPRPNLLRPRPADQMQLTWPPRSAGSVVP
jgi:catechol 2,3-dioxygenase-like lactoylglutathione lyase family enzyme